jgi:hypothetical protein
MKEIKPYYYKFEWKERLITLCLIWESELSGTSLFIGYAVKIPEDKELLNLSEKIALGRALKHKTRLGRKWGYCEVNYNDDLCEDKGFLKAIARNCENNIKKGKIVIKGIR